MTPTVPEIYILWHPRCALGETLAQRIYGWLRPGNGLGPPVYYRSLPAPGAQAGDLPLALPGEARSGSVTSATTGLADLQIVLLLIDQQMIADVAWHRWLWRLGEEKSGVRRQFLPVALDSTAYNAPGRLRETNFLRPTGLPFKDQEPSARDLEIVVRSLLKQLTETLCRLLLSTQPEQAQDEAALDAATAPKIKIFLSHAKADGTIPAKRIRDYIYSQTQLTAFYDENDIPFGSPFQNVLKDRVAGPGKTAAMIAVRSAYYARRPWCRRELALFRRPRREPPEAGGPERWSLNPVLVVDAMEDGSQSHGVPEFGNAPLLRWSRDIPEQEEQVVTTALRDVLLAAFHNGLGRKVPGQANRIVINWLPDPTTLLGMDSIRSAAGELQIVYPGRGLSGLDLDILYEFFPNLEFLSFERVMP